MDPAPRLTGPLCAAVWVELPRSGGRPADQGPPQRRGRTALGRHWWTACCHTGSRRRAAGMDPQTFSAEQNASHDSPNTQPDWTTAGDSRTGRCIGRPGGPGTWQHPVCVTGRSPHCDDPSKPRASETQPQDQQPQEPMGPGWKLTPAGLELASRGRRLSQTNSIMKTVATHDRRSMGKQKLATSQGTVSADRGRARHSHGHSPPHATPPSTCCR